MNEWIRKNYGTQQNLDRKLGLPLKTVNRWLNSDPRTLLRHLPELVESSGDTHESIVDMIMDKQNKTI